MKVLLATDIEKLGWVGDVVNVNDGYARNYLLPQGLAVSPTEANIKALTKAKAQAAAKRKLAAKKLAAVASAVDGAEAVIAARANEQGHLFGSVSASQIGANLREQGFEVADEVVESFHIKEVGTHAVKLTFGPEVTATVNVVVVPEGTETDDEQAASPEPQESPAAE